MNKTFDFYRERYNDIQRHAYLFLNQVPLTDREQTQIIRKYCLGIDFTTINSVQDYNDDWLIKGYVKVDIRDVEEPVCRIKGKFLDTGNFLKETMVQLPKRLFDMEEDVLKKAIFSGCMEIAEQRINKHIASLQMQKIQIEAEIERYSEMLREYPVGCDEKL